MFSLFLCIIYRICFYCVFQNVKLLNVWKYYLIIIYLIIIHIISVCVCVCVCGPGNKGTKYPDKVGNIQNPCPCGDIFGPHEETSL